MSDADLLEQLKICICRQTLYWSQAMGDLTCYLIRPWCGSAACWHWVKGSHASQMWLTPLIYWSPEKYSLQFSNKFLPLIVRALQWQINEMCMPLWSMTPDCRFEEYFLPDTPETTFGDEILRNLLDTFTANDMALVVSIRRGSTCTKLVRMWNRWVSCIA